jgi:protein SCO1/2
MRTQRGFASRSTLLVIAAAFAAGLGLFAAQRWMRPPSLDLRVVQLIDPARKLPDAHLRYSNGPAAGLEEVAGHWTVVFLGFTHCPDVCPTTLAELAKAQRQWEALPAASRPKVLFVSVDPERETPASVGEYAHFFHRDTMAASGSLADLSAFANALGLVFMKVPTVGKDYTIDHSATLVVLDPRGQEAGLIRPKAAGPDASGAEFSWADIASDLALLSKARP